MPEPRIRDVAGSGAVKPRTRPSAVKASGDSMACNVCPHQEIFRSSSKHKTPRSMRYDLENALVGLCDVWFDEIKPYLVRNHIKLHVNCSSAGGDHERPAATTASPRFDPGAASDHPPRTARCAGSSASQAARTPKCDTATEHPSNRRPLPPLPSVPQTPRDNQDHPHKNQQKQLGQPCIRRSRRRAQSKPNWRVPRLCRTFTVLCRPDSSSGAVKTNSDAPLQPPRDDYYRFIVPRRESVMKNKSTQTERVPNVNRGCQSRRPLYHSPAPCADVDTPHDRAADSIGSASPPQVRPPRVICRFKQTDVPLPEASPLLADDLMDIIAESNEKRLKLLYSSSEKDDHSTFINLIRSCRQEKSGHKKLPPWR